MDEVIPIHKAKTNFSKLVKQAQAGKTIYIGSYGRQEVMLVSAVDANAQNRKMNLDDFLGAYGDSFPKGATAKLRHERDNWE